MKNSRYDIELNLIWEDPQQVEFVLTVASCHYPILNQHIIHQLSNHIVSHSQAIQVKGVGFLSNRMYPL